MVIDADDVETSQTAGAGAAATMANWSANQIYWLNSWGRDHDLRDGMAVLPFRNLQKIINFAGVRTRWETHPMDLWR